MPLSLSRLILDHVRRHPWQTSREIANGLAEDRFIRQDQLSSAASTVSKLYRDTELARAMAPGEEVYRYALVGALPLASDTDADPDTDAGDRSRETPNTPAQAGSDPISNSTPTPTPTEHKVQAGLRLLNLVEAEIASHRKVVADLDAETSELADQIEALKRQMAENDEAAHLRRQLAGDLEELLEAAQVAS